MFINFIISLIFILPNHDFIYILLFFNAVLLLDVYKRQIESKKTPSSEREIAPHPSLKPQAFIRKIVYASLPTGEGVILDPFAGSGSTLAAAVHYGYECIGIEKDLEYYKLAQSAIPKLADLYPEQLRLSL